MPLDLDLRPAMAQRLHDEALSLGATVARDVFRLALIAWQIHEDRLWQYLRLPIGRLCGTEEEYFEAYFDVDSWRTAAKRIRIGRMLAALPEPETYLEDLAHVGTAKAEMIAPLVIDAADEAQGDGRLPAAVAKAWIARARHMPAPALREAVRLERGQAPRATGDATEDRPLATARGWMPSLEAQEVLDEAMRVYRRMTPAGRFIGLLQAACMEFIGTYSDTVHYEVHAGPSGAGSQAAKQPTSLQGPAPAEPDERPAPA